MLSHARRERNRIFFAADDIATRTLGRDELLHVNIQSLPGICFPPGIKRLRF